MLLPHHHTERVRITRVAHGLAREVEDVVSVEEPLEIRVEYGEGRRPRTHSLSVTMRTPGHDFELAAGFLLTEGLIAGRSAIRRVTYCCEDAGAPKYNIVSVRLHPGTVFDPSRLARHFYATSSCGVCGKASLEALEIRGCTPLDAAVPVVAAEAVPVLPTALRAGQTDFARTGGLHAAALFDAQGKLICLREDVGRHNAVDKVIGERLLEGATSLAGCVLVVSGRAGFEIVQKALVARVPVVVAVGAPSSLAVELARRFGMTLIGFAHGNGFNVYADSGRIAGG